MSRNQKHSLGVNEVTDSSAEPSDLQLESLVDRHEKPSSPVKSSGIEAVATWIAQFSRTVGSTVSDPFPMKRQAGKGIFPRFLFWARNRSHEARTSALRIVQSMLSSMAKSPQSKLYRPTDESLFERTERGVDQVLVQAFRSVGSKRKRFKRATERSELPEHLVTGLKGEQIALDYFLQKGWKLIDRNVRALGGEIDLVMFDQGVIVFVEVKTWGSKTDEDPAEAVDLYKQRTLTRAGLAYLRKKRWLEKPARFDVVSVRISLENCDASGEKQGPQLRHFRSAFESQGDSFFG